MFDATFWVAISFLLFILLLIYKKVPTLVLQQIDNKQQPMKICFAQDKQMGLLLWHTLRILNDNK